MILNATAADRSGLRISERTLTDEGSHLTLKYRIRDAARLSSGALVVIFDPNDMPKSLRPINLWALSCAGELLWVAAPFDGVHSYYTSIHSTYPLMVASWSGFLCTIDDRDGALLDSVFVK
jgi:hypothetical protein